MSDHYEQWYESQELKGRNMAGVPSPYGQIRGRRGDALREHRHRGVDVPGVDASTDEGA